ncbi:MAG: hypothetical protein H0W55_05075 [Actinobacteria bacterium]|nr:hypothetical protein [Actinomycetota bacterium]MDQ3533061.1 hypothetical protein [Actinomycetota bacterium]
MGIGTLASSVGKGLFAGLAGTAAMTASSTLEMKVRGRAGSSAPADAAQKVLGVEPVDDAAKERFSNLAHWGYGTGWGAVRGVLAAAGLSGLPATALHFLAVWGSETVMLPRLGVAPPISEWGAKEVGVDVLHHLVYAMSTNAAYEWMDAGP